MDTTNAMLDSSERRYFPAALSARAVSDKGRPAVDRRDRQLSLHDAIIDACHKRSCPIVMTTVAMMAGMLPIALGWGADASFRQPMAVAVIGGLFTSTALSLLVVPVVYTYVDRIERFLSRLRKPRRASVPDRALETAVR